MTIWEKMMHLLVVDDDSVTRMVLRTLLTSEGYSVTTAADAADALQKLSEVSFDMVITDIYMPRMDGIRFRDIIRAGDHKDVPILFISGFDEQGRVESLADHTREGFFRKGRPLTELLEWIKYLRTPIHKRGAERPSVARRLTSKRKVAARQQRSASSAS